MSTLKELNELENAALVAERKARDTRHVQESLRSIRIGDKPLMVVYKGMGHWEEHMKSLIEGVINECGPDLLRIVEMRQEAFARRCTAQARQMRAALAAAVDPEPSKEGGST